MTLLKMQAKTLVMTFINSIVMSCPNRKRTMRSEVDVYHAKRLLSSMQY
jgi:hypothetical protein